MIKIIRNKNIRYIHPDNIRYVIETPDGYTVYTNSSRDEIRKDEFDPDKSELVKCGNYYFSTICIGDVEVLRTKDAFIVSCVKEIGKKFTDIECLKNLVDGFYEVTKIDDSCVYLNPVNIETVDKPFSTAVMKITSGTTVSEVPIEVGDQITTCTVTIAGGKKFKFDSQEAVQLLSHYKEEVPKAKKEKTPSPA